MAKFNAEEVSALQAGGNEVSMYIYLSHYHSFSSTNILTKAFIYRELDKFILKIGILSTILTLMPGI